MSLTTDLNAFVKRLTLAATSAPDEAAVRRNVEELAEALRGATLQMDDRLRYGSFDVDGREPPFARKL